MVKAALIALALAGAALMPAKAMAQDPLLQPPATEAPPAIPSAEGPAPLAPAPAAPQPSHAAAAEPQDLVSILKRAHWVVKAVMAVLSLMVLWVLTIFFYKAVETTIANRRLVRCLHATPGQPLKGAGRTLVQTAEADLAALPPALSPAEAEAARETFRLRQDRLIAGALRDLRSGTGPLAQIAATAPFIGLFGTVFGIMNAFLAIAATQSTNLATVAPGIAEALLATAIGLVAAIPAMIVHNMLTRRIAGFRHHLTDLAATLQTRALRDIARRSNPGT